MEMPRQSERHTMRMRHEDGMTWNECGLKLEPNVHACACALVRKIRRVRVLCSHKERKVE